MTETSTHAVVDERIILSIAGGDNSALAELYTKTKNAVYCFALSIVRDMETAQDVMQETYIQVYRSAKNYIPSHRDPMPWLLGIAKHIAYAELRSRTPVAELGDVENTADSIDSLSLSEDKLLARTLLTKLREDERQIVVLHVVAGLKHREIADIMELPLSTVLNKYNRSIKKLGRLAGDAI